jgi:SAM-dependent methyltransferase
MPGLPGRELYFDRSLGALDRWYCRLLGVPIVGLRIRLRRLRRILPASANSILDAGCGRGVITRMLAKYYPAAIVDGVDENASGQEINRAIAKSMALENCRFSVADLVSYRPAERYDLVVSIDNLEHVREDEVVLHNFYISMQVGGLLAIHVPHYYRRWPIFRWVRNFDVPGHVRPGYHLPELTERVRRAGFAIVSSGFSYGWLENLANNASYAITGAKEQRKWIYALLFPLLNGLSWLGQWSRPKSGAGVWLVAKKEVPSLRNTRAVEKS